MKTQRRRSCLYPDFGNSNRNHFPDKTRSISFRTPTAQCLGRPPIGAEVGGCSCAAVTLLGEHQVRRTVASKAHRGGPAFSRLLSMASIAVRRLPGGESPSALSWAHRLASRLALVRALPPPSISPRHRTRHRQPACRSGVPFFSWLSQVPSASSLAGHLCCPPILRLSAWIPDLAQRATRSIM